MREAYTKRLEAGKARGGRAGKIERQWHWDENTADIVHENLRKDVVAAFRAYVKQQLDHRHIIPMSRLRSVEHTIVSNPMAWKAKKDFKGNEELDNIPQEETHIDVTVPACQLSNLLTPEPLNYLTLVEGLMEDALLVILQHPRTVRMHMAIHKLAAYVGEQSTQQWAVVGKQDLENLGLEHVMSVPGSPQGHSIDSEAIAAEEREMRKRAS